MKSGSLLSSPAACESVSDVTVAAALSDKVEVEYHHQLILYKQVQEDHQNVGLVKITAEHEEKV